MAGTATTLLLTYVFLEETYKCNGINRSIKFGFFYYFTIETAYAYNMGQEFDLVEY